MSSRTLSDHSLFNNKERSIAGWYWALQAAKLKRGKVQGVTLLGEPLVLYRTQSGKVQALEAHCPHMGAHLRDGQVEGEELRCPFHYWKFGADGRCTDIPCATKDGTVAKVRPLRSFPTAEHLGLLWVWTGDGKPGPLPYDDEKLGPTVRVRLANTFVKKTHPSVMMINAIDAQHFYSVHPLSRKLAGELDLRPRTLSRESIEFANQSAVPRNSLFNRSLAHFYAGPLTYRLLYWYAATGFVTAGPDALPLFVMFALRPTADGQSEGQTVCITPRRPGVRGWLLNQVELGLAWVVATYFAKGDTTIFEGIRFRMETPLTQDRAIVRFIQHTERQQASNWGSARFAKQEESPC